MALQIVHGGKLTCILEFYEKVLKHLQSLEIMEKRNTIKNM